MSQPNWLGLLKWSLAYSDGTEASQFAPMTEEDKAWLERVMKEGVRDDPARLNELMLRLQGILDQGPTEADEETIELSLEEIKEIVEQIDMAQVFTKFGGVKCLLRMLQDDRITNEMKALAASVVGTIAQNNIMVQDILYSDEVLQKLMTIYVTSDSPLLCTKILYSVSCAVRSHAAMEELFVLSFARAALSKAFSSAHEPLISRAVFLSNALLTSDYSSLARIETLAGLIVPAVFSRFPSMSVDVQENTLGLLTSLLHTAYGHRLLNTEQLRGALDEALTRRTEFLRAAVSSGDYTEEEVAHNVNLLNGLRSLLQAPVSVRYPIASSTASTAPPPPPPAATAAAVSVAISPPAPSVTNSDDALKAAVAVASGATTPHTTLLLGPPAAAPAPSAPTN